MVVTSANSLDEVLDRLFDYNVEFDLRTDYSGRAMYGKTCIGFVTDNAIGVAMALAVVLREIEIENDDRSDGKYDDLPNWSDLRASTDSMGLSSIIYFRNWSAEDN